jgi:hypothetical protein
VEDTIVLEEIEEIDVVDTPKERSGTKKADVDERLIRIKAATKRVLLFWLLMGLV